MNNPVIKIKNLKFFYEKASILNEVHLEIKKGEFIGIFGPNGGGKTTFLKLLMGFLKPSEGSISVFGMSPKAARCHIGYAPQAASFDKQFPISVLELVLMGCLSETRWWGGYSAKTKEKAKRALKKVGMLEQQHAPFGSLSGGQAQRALIARALVGEPELLLLDEPTASIDPEAEKEIHQLLMDLKGSMTILMVTHDLQAIMNKAERLLCIHREVTSFLPKEVCEHFAMGLYHAPLGRVEREPLLCETN